MKTAIYVAIALLAIATLVMGYRAYTDEEMGRPESRSNAVATGASEVPPTPADIRAHIEEHAGLIRLASPIPYEAVESPLDVEGRARGIWFFEGSFPLVLVDWDGRIIGEGYASADGDWMTEEFVPFRGTIEFETPESGERGALILRKHNASDRPELDDALEVPVRFVVE